MCIDFVKNFTSGVDIVDEQLLLHWLPILLMVAAGLAFVVINLFLSKFLGDDRPTFTKLSPYESGNEPEGLAYERVSIHFSIIAVLFILFDIEIIFMYPWAMVMDLPEIKWQAFSAVSVFVTILAVGYFYAWREGVLDWR